MNKETMDYLLSDDTSKVQSNQPQTTTTPETEEQQQEQQETKESNEESSEQEDSDNESEEEEDDDEEAVELIENIPEALSAAQHIVDQVSVNLEEFKKDNIDFVTSQTRAIEILNGALDIYERVLDQTVGDEDEDEEENAGENDEAADEKQKEALKQRRAARESIETAKIAFDYSTALVMKLKMENSIAMFGAVMKVLSQQQQADQTGTGNDDSAASSTAATSSATAAATAAASSSSSSSSSSRKIFAFNDDSDEDEEQEEAEENDDEEANHHEEEEDTSAMALSMVEMAKSILNNKMYDDETSESEKQQCYTLLSKIHCNAADIFLEHDAFDMAINESEQALGLYDDIDMDQSVEDIEAVSRLVEHMKQKAVIHNKIASSVLFKDGADIDMAIEHYEEAESLLIKCVEKMKQVNGMNQEAIQDTEFTLEELQVRIQELKQSEEERKALEEQSKLAETKGQENSNKPVHVLVPKRKRTASEEDVATTEANKKQKLA